MSEIADRYARLADAFAGTVAGVPADRWANPSPCEGWTARDVVQHVVDAHAMQLGFVGRDLGDVPSVDEDPLGAVRGAKAAVHTDLTDPARATTPLQGLAGETTFEQSVDAFLSFDLVVHRWDLARATGLEERIDTDDVRWAADAAASFGELIRSDGVCGPELTPPPGADEQTRLLAYLGRHAW
ncbi:TIGR03086 family protein [Egibacter rhizosphaerae]|uniref:TIGR03086 family protein n=1 Tax=Egibacter rhizosphaerae TaxID=1670831 RepID=A0A411YBM4_9ACTN|nr:TIGR03086 family metal-binding protein [Egibacter rhizosphaerae]QBI18578.1 TIGR03086 family protein [Egibacter rhizosphaerae]